MKSLRCMTGSLTFAVAVVFTARFAPAQSSNSQAIKWFDAGVTEKDFQNFKNVQAQLGEQKLLEEQYVAGMTALKAHDWTRAILTFEKILDQDRDFRDVRKRLTEAQSGLERDSTETMMARHYVEGVSAMNKNDLGAALAAFEKVRKLNSNYRDVAALYAEVASSLQSESAIPSSAPKSQIAAANVDSLYQAGLAAFENKDWIQAVVALEKVQLLQPNYRETVDHLVQARVNLEMAGKTASLASSKESGGSPSYLGGVLAALVVLPLLGAALLSPVTRARLHLMRGNYPAAIQIYESLLTQNPSRVKFYPVLANLYLLQGRRDESAMKVYRTILQLNLNTNNRDEINAIIAQNYLTEGRTDSDAIEVLESALKAEQRKQSHYS